MAGSFNKSTGAPLGIDYFTMAFQADNNLAISALEVQLSIESDQVATIISSAALFEVSYSSTMDPSLLVFTGTPPVVPTTPSDIGNVIYRSYINLFIPASTAANNSSLYLVDDYRRYEPYNYLLKYNQTIYMHVGLGTAILGNGAGATISGSFIFHTLATGLKI